MCASPDHTPLDNVDRAILQILQRDARNTTAFEIGNGSTFYLTIPDSAGTPDDGR